MSEEAWKEAVAEVEAIAKERKALLATTEALIERLSRECATLMDGNANRWTVVQPFFIQFAAELPASRRIKELEAERDSLDRRLTDEQTAYYAGEEIGREFRARAETAEAQRDRLASRVERLRGALEPFASAADDLDADRPDHRDLWEHPAALNLTGGHLRTARAVHKEANNAE